jgi:hypothetical protein
MAKRSLNFRNFKQNPFNRDMLDRDALKHEFTQKRDSLRHTIAEKRDALKRDTGPGHSFALTMSHKIAVAGVATLGAAAVAVSLVPDHSSPHFEVMNSAPAAYSVVNSAPARTVHASVTPQGAAATRQARIAAATNAKSDATGAGIAKGAYPNNLNGWIRESLAIMKKHHIPGSYSGLYRNILRESSGNPMAINNWDINAQNGVPSKGLLQVIPPTFQTYHVSGTSWDIYNPVANITAAANYAADRYGSMDNVNSAY